MHLSRRRITITSVLGFLIAVPAAVVVLCALPQHAAPKSTASEVVLKLDPALSKVHWTLGSTAHTVHGSFAFKRGDLHLDTSTGNARGEIIVDAASGSSGNDGRDKKMHKDVLESSRYTEVIFRPDRVEGQITPQGTSRVKVHGQFVLHGSEHELTVPVHAELSGDHWTAEARFSVPFIDWGLKNPSNFFLKVNHAAEIELELKGSLQNAAAP
jgi:polyisoprenoid-binding protein YceI